MKFVFTKQKKKKKKQDGGGEVIWKDFKVGGGKFSVKGGMVVNIFGFMGCMVLQRCTTVAQSS